MPNDAKLGMFVGVGLVIAVAAVFFRTDGPAASVPGQAAVVPASRTTPPPASRAPYRSVRARPATRSTAEASATRRHTVQDGETLYTLAQRYYGDRTKFEAILQANRTVIDKPDDLMPGTELEIPELPAAGPPDGEVGS